MIIDNCSLIIVFCSLPFILFGTIGILPTFDDWTSLVAPSQEPLFIKERFLFYGYHWRPFDSMFGWIVGQNPYLLFPTLNHICVVLGHLGCTILLYYLTKLFLFKLPARHITTLFFFFSPGMLATVLAVDGLNQTYANFWGLLSCVSYIKLNGLKKYLSWIPLVIISTLCKENGLMFAFIAPLLSFGFGYSNKNTLTRDITIGILVFIIYFLLILVLPSNIIIHQEYIPSIEKSFSGVLKFLLSTWVAVDFVYLLHHPSRNLVVVSICLIFSVPFLYILFKNGIRLIRTRKLLCLIACHVISVAPHLGTVYSLMHTYAGLAFASLIIGYLVCHIKNNRYIIYTFILYMSSALFVDIHLWYESYKSGMIGKKMAIEAIEKTGKPIDEVYLIIINDDYQRLSSFKVVPHEAFGWGLAALHETNYKWPNITRIDYIENINNANKQALQLANTAIEKDEYDCVWIIDGNNVKVIR